MLKGFGVFCDDFYDSVVVGLCFGALLAGFQAAYIGKCKVKRPFAEDSGIGTVYRYSPSAGARACNCLAESRDEYDSSMELLLKRARGWIEKRPRLWHRRGCPFAEDASRCHRIGPLIQSCYERC